MASLKIKKVTPHIVDVPVKDSVFPRVLPFGVFPGLVRVITSIELENMESGKVTIGYGECPPTHPFTNETPLSVYELISGYIAPSLEGINVRSHTVKETKENIDNVIETLIPYLRNQKMAMAATDHALHDAFAREADIPVWRFLCQEPKRDRLKGCWSTSGDHEKSVEESKKYLKKGYAVKIKLFGNLSQDLMLTEKVIEIAEHIDDSVVCSDANESYTPDMISQYLETLRLRHGPRLEKKGFFVEEPINVKKYGIDKLARIINTSSYRIMLDESIVSKEDAEYFIEMAERDEIRKNKLLFNIKIDKVGGLYAATEIAGKAKRYGIGIMIGGMFPSSYGKLVNCQFAISMDNVIPSDGVHPSIDYVSVPLIKKIDECEKMLGGYRDLSVFYALKGMGGEIDEEVLRESIIQIDLPDRYLSKVVKSRIPEFDKMKI